MSITFEKTNYSGSFPKLWRGEAKMLPGGFKPAQSFAVGTVIKVGTPVIVDFETQTAAIVKVATALAGTTTKSVKVAKGSLFQVGDSVMVKGGDAKAIVSAIDTTNVAHDVLTLATALTGAAPEAVIVESKAESAEAKYGAPNAIIGADKLFDGKGIDTLDVAYEAVVIYTNAYPVLPEWLTGFGLTANPSIKYIKQ